MTESQIEKWLGKQLRMMGCLYYKFVSPGTDGVPDRIIITPDGAIVFVELKTTDGKLSRMQQYQIGRIRKHNCIVWVSHGIEDARQLVEVVRIMMEERHGV